MSRRLISLLATATLAVGAPLMAASPARAEHRGHGSFSGYGRGYNGFGYGRGYNGFGYGRSYYGFGYGRGYNGFGYDRGYYGGFFLGFYGYGRGLRMGYYGFGY